MTSSNEHSALALFLSRLLLRSKLSAEEQRAILDLPFHQKQIAPHRDIIRPGEHTDEATLVARGLIARYDAMKDGQRQITALYIRGDMCDLHSVVAPTAGWGLGALNSSIVLRVPHSELKRLAATYPAIAIAFWRDTTVDGSILSKWVGNIGRRDARERVAHLICEMGIRSEAVGIGSRDCFPFNMTQVQLADAVGVTSVHVNRTLQELRRDKVIRTLNRTVTVPNWQKLCEVAEFDPTYLLLPASVTGATASKNVMRQTAN
jgi:CRP-like cAMP-binding protein